MPSVGAGHCRQQSETIFYRQISPAFHCHVYLDGMDNYFCYQAAIKQSCRGRINMACTWRGLLFNRWNYLCHQTHTIKSCRISSVCAIGQHLSFHVGIFLCITDALINSGKSQNNERSERMERVEKMEAMEPIKQANLAILKPLK